MSQPLSPGSMVAHYRIVSRLGAGGMGEVYLAQDTRLERTVALKVLPASVVEDPERGPQWARRFLQEAKAASALSHPNVAHIYEVGEADGINFLAMEYVEGQPLSSRIAGRPLPTPEILDIGIQIADALDEAHAKGVTHRDIKPSNIMITARGRVKVLDFGLAKISRPSQTPESETATQAMTAPGVILGTVHYMSPEQALGRGVDHRTDIFSLGAVLYEAATGRLPFSGQSAPETITHILHSQPEAIARLNYDIPPELERIIRKSLEKDRERRYQSARDLLVDLNNLKRDSTSGAVATTPSHTLPPAADRTFARSPLRYVLAFLVVALLAGGSIWLYRAFRTNRAVDSIAVLPFVNAGGDPNAEYLSDGITDSIISTLSQIPKLRVMARSTVFQFKGADPKKAGHDLKVSAVLAGRVLQRGDTLSVRAELVNVDDGSQLWGGQYNRRLSDLLTVQEEIAREISDKLRLQLSGEERKRLAKRYTDNTEAYQLYLKGRFHWTKLTQEGMRKGIESFQQAIEKDPSYALAYTGLAEAYVVLASFDLPPKEAFPKAKAAVDKALQLDDSLAEAHSMAGVLKGFYDWDWSGAEKELRRAVELNPGSAAVHDWYGWFLIYLGRFEESQAQLKRALELDPLSVAYNSDLGTVLTMARQYDRSNDQFRKLLEIDPNYYVAHLSIGWNYELKGQFPEAIAAMQKARQIEDSPWVKASLAPAYALSGNRAEAQKLLERLQQLRKQKYFPPFFMVYAHLGLGDKEQALAWMEKAYEDRSLGMFFIKVDPFLDPIRPDPRFQNLLKRLRL